ncbi:hydroxymethylglutaryl-CoA reductase (NADPH) [Elsinoe australis]|uniref:3-hydroxy-3-methylglutaryl coenzyme A reductase n=1 Tax=Elsinoe australis TaxID=40998 RepID=A0A2P7YDE1_9PEZI|nr:hydroxymethylglutaryl-CoA reductase (NADPH) [Elsinoe australis]
MATHIEVAENMLVSESKPLVTERIEGIDVLSPCSTPGNEYTDVPVDSGYASDYTSSDDSFKGLHEGRSQDECLRMHITGQTSLLNDAEILALVQKGNIPAYSLESALQDHARAVGIRRRLVAQTSNSDEVEQSFLHNLPWQQYDYTKIHGRCAENVIGYTQVPLGVAGPLMVDDREVFIPMSTTEGTLIASTSRGCKALNAAGGVATEITGDAMTRAPVVHFDNTKQAAAAKRFLDSVEGQAMMKETFGATTGHGALLDCTTRIAGRHLYLRFRARSGDAMGMNMLSKGSEAIVRRLQAEFFPQMRIISLSGNLCTDKKPAAVNWIEGRGKSVVAETRLTPEVLSSVLKTSADSLQELNIAKNYVGSALAGMSTGGFNAHAANIVTAVFLATGQDPAQVVTSSNCLTMMEASPDGSLLATVTMPSVEVGTVGGGTHLPAQSAMLDMLGCRRRGLPDGENASNLARIVAAAVLAGELSLCSALASGDL